MNSSRQCRVFAAPFTVRLPLENSETDDNKNKNIVEPDLAIVCEKNKLDQGGVFILCKLYLIDVESNLRKLIKAWE